MRITNARIKNVAVVIDDRDRLSARMSFYSQDTRCDWSFVLDYPPDLQRLMTLMRYVGVYNVADLEGKIIRKVDSERERFIQGVGHPIDDKFIPVLADEFKEISEKEFEKFFKE